MKVLHATVGAVALLAAVAASGPAFAGGGYRSYHGPRVGVGVTVGVPFWGPGWYPRPYYYPYAYPYAYPYPYYAYPYSYYPSYGPPAAPQAYIERDDIAPAPSQPQQQQPQQQSHYWYYCPASKAYYPYVRECPGGWQQVPAQPPS